MEVGLKGTIMSNSKILQNKRGNAITAYYLKLVQLFNNTSNVLLSNRNECGHFWVVQNKRNVVKY